MVTGLDYSFKAAMTYPKMTLIKPSFEDDVLSLTAPGCPDIKFSLKGLTKEVTGK
jgi:hypothetical protein